MVNREQTKVCVICRQVFARRASKATNDGWKQRVVCYSAECALAQQRVREGRNDERRRQEAHELRRPRPKKSLAELYGGRRYEDDPRAR